MEHQFNMRRCVVPNCEMNCVRKFYLPRDKQISDIWFERINNPSLKYRHRNSICICATHFDCMCISKSGKLQKFSLPTLHLPSFSEKSCKESCFSYPRYFQKYYATPYSYLNSIWETTSAKEINTSFDIKYANSEVNIPQRTYPTPKQKLLLSGKQPGATEEIYCDSEHSISVNRVVDKNKESDTNDEGTVEGEVTCDIEDEKTDRIDVCEEIDLNIKNYKDNLSLRQNLLQQIINKANSYDDESFYKWAKMTLMYMKQIK